MGPTRVQVTPLFALILAQTKQRSLQQVLDRLQKQMKKHDYQDLLLNLPSLVQDALQRGWWVL